MSPAGQIEDYHALRGDVFLPVYRSLSLAVWTLIRQPLILKRYESGARSWSEIIEEMTSYNFGPKFSRSTWITGKLPKSLDFNQTAKLRRLTGRATIKCVELLIH